MNIDRFLSSAELFKKKIKHEYYHLLHPEIVFGRAYMLPLIIGKRFASFSFACVLHNTPEKIAISCSNYFMPCGRDGKTRVVCV